MSGGIYSKNNRHTWTLPLHTVWVNLPWSRVCATRQNRSREDFDRWDDRDKGAACRYKKKKKLGHALLCSWICTQTHSETGIYFFCNRLHHPSKSQLSILNAHTCYHHLKVTACIQSCRKTASFCQCCNAPLAQEFLPKRFLLSYRSRRINYIWCVSLSFPLSPFVSFVCLQILHMPGCFFLSSSSQSLICLSAKIPEIWLPWLSVSEAEEKFGTDWLSLSPSIPPAKEEMRCVLQQRFSSLLLSFLCLLHSLPFSLFQFHKPIEKPSC